MIGFCKFDVINRKYNVRLSDNGISEMGKIQYKKYIEVKVNALALDGLQNCSNSRVEVDRQNFVEMQSYLLLFLRNNPMKFLKNRSSSCLH